MNGQKIYVLRRSKTEIHTYEGRSLRTAGLESVRDQLGTSSNAGKLLERALLENIEVRYIGGFADKLGNAYIVPLKIN